MTTETATEFAARTIHEDVSMLTLKQSMELAGRNLLAILSPSRGYQPLWSMAIEEDNQAHSNYYWPSHNIGRWWDAMLRLEAATGFAVPPDIEAAMLRNLRACFDNPLQICGHLREDRNAPLGWIDDHSQRESLMALAALARYRGSEWAVEQAARSIRALDRYIGADGCWDVDLMKQLTVAGGRTVGDVPAPYCGAEGVGLVGTHGRMLEAVLEVFVATGDLAALSLADRLACLHLEISTRPDGTVPAAEYIHTHSLFGTYRGLLRYGELTGKREFIDRIALTYETTVRTSIRRSGFISHDWGHDKRGETTSPGDAAQVALKLASLGYPEYLDDAERLIRCRVLPSQILEPLGLRPNEGRTGDDFEMLEERVVGAFGGMHRHPHGEKRPTTDITAADLHTLCDIYEHCVRPTPEGIWVDFALDREHPSATVCTEQGHRESVQATLTRPANLFVHVPAWVDRGTVRATVEGDEVTPGWTAVHASLGRVDAGARACVSYDTPVERDRESAEGVEYEIAWRGHDVVGISPNPPVRPFYASLGVDG